MESGLILKIHIGHDHGEDAAKQDDDQVSYNSEPRNTQFLCLDCLAADIPTTREKLEALIQWFYRTGVCTLFVLSEDGKEDTCDGKEPGSSDF